MDPSDGLYDRRYVLDEEGYYIISFNRKSKVDEDASDDNYEWVEDDLADEVAEAEDITGVEENDENIVGGMEVEPEPMVLFGRYDDSKGMKKCATIEIDGGTTLREVKEVFSVTIGRKVVKIESDQLGILNGDDAPIEAWDLDNGSFVSLLF
jgi:hypothetical protein